MNPNPPLHTEGEAFWTYYDLLVFIALIAPALLVAMALVALGAHFNPELLEHKALLLLPAQFVGYGVWFASLYLWLKLKYQQPFWRSMAWFKPGDGVARHLLMGPLLALSIGLLGMLLQTPDVSMPMRELLNSRTAILLVGFFAVTLGPVCEELAFRGFMLPLLTRSMGAATAIIVTALPFSLLHGPQYAWSWRHLLLLTVAGAVFGWVRYNTRSTLAATLVHATYNLTFFVTYLFNEKDIPQTW